MEIALSYIKIYDKVALIKTVWFSCMNCYITVGPELKVKWRESESVRSLSHVWLLWSPWTVAHQAPLSMGFSRQEYWSGLSCPPPDPGIEPVSLWLLNWQAGSLPLAPPGWCWVTNVASQNHWQRNWNLNKLNQGN